MGDHSVVIFIIIMSGHLTVKTEYIFKVLVVGELGCGKTSLIKRYVHQFFSEHYRATIGVDFALKVINYSEDTIVRLQLWDIAGQERFGNMTRVYYRDAAAAFVVFDLTRRATFEAVRKWKEDLDEKVVTSDGAKIPTILLANKSDLSTERSVTDDEVYKLSQELGFTSWYSVSAREGDNVDEAGDKIVSFILQRELGMDKMTERMIRWPERGMVLGRNDQ